MKNCIALPIERLADEVQRFTKRPDVRIMHVAADEDLRSGALRVLLSAEHLASNRSPWFVVEDSAESPSWSKLEQALAQQHAKMREDGVPLGELKTALSGEDAARFAARLCQCGDSVQAPAEGMVVLLCCGASQLDARWLQHLTKMVFDPVLGGVRFVLFGTRCETTWEWSEQLPPGQSISHCCAVDPQAAAQELEQEIEAEAAYGVGQARARPPDADPPPPAKPGSVLPPLPPGPPPARVDAPSEPIETPELCAKRAALAMQRKEGVEATRQQARARDLCVGDQRLEDAVRMELVLGCYMIELGEIGHAQQSFAQAAQRAQEVEAHELEAQAHYCQAWTWRKQKQVDSTLRSYWDGIDAAKRGNHARQAFDGYWEAGLILEGLERTGPLVSLWSDALSYANTVEPALRKGTRLPDIATELSAILDKMRRPADARAVDDWAKQAIGENDAGADTSS